MNILNNIDREINKIAANMPFSNAMEGIILAIIVFYSSTLAMKLPPPVLEHMATTPAKIISLAFVLSLAIHKPTISLALAVGIFASINAVQHRGFWEQFIEEREDEGTPYTAADKIVPGPALKNDMFKTRQRMRVAKSAGVTSDDNLFQTAPYGFDIAV